MLPAQTVGNLQQAMRSCTPCGKRSATSFCALPPPFTLPLKCLAIWPTNIHPQQLVCARDRCQILALACRMLIRSTHAQQQQPACSGQHEAAVAHWPQMLICYMQDHNPYSARHALCHLTAAHHCLDHTALPPHPAAIECQALPRRLACANRPHTVQHSATLCLRWPTILSLGVCRAPLPFRAGRRPSRPSCSAHRLPPLWQGPQVVSSKVILLLVCPVGAGLHWLREDSTLELSSAVRPGGLLLVALLALAALLLLALSLHRQTRGGVQPMAAAA